MNQRGVALIFTLVVLAVMSAMTVVSAQHLRLQYLVERNATLRQQGEQINQSSLAQEVSNVISFIETRPAELPTLLELSLFSDEQDRLLNPSELCLDEKGGITRFLVSSLKQTGAVSWRSRVAIVAREAEDCVSEQHVEGTYIHTLESCHQFRVIACTEQLGGRLVLSASRQLTVSQWQTQCVDSNECVSDKLVGRDHIQIQNGNWQREVSYAASPIQ